MNSLFRCHGFRRHGFRRQGFCRNCFVRNCFGQLTDITLVPARGNANVRKEAGY